MSEEISENNTEEKDTKAKITVGESEIELKNGSFEKDFLKFNQITMNDECILMQAGADSILKLYNNGAFELRTLKASIWSNQEGRLCICGHNYKNIVLDDNCIKLINGQSRITIAENYIILDSPNIFATSKIKDK